MERAAFALGVDNGAFKGDLIISDGKPRIIEVTARTSGGFDSQYRKPYSFGIDILKATIDIAAGKDLTAGGGNIILRSNGTVSATTYTGSGANLTGVEPFPSGTKQVFYQASAPTGWTQDTTAALNEAVMSVVTGSGGGTGGTTAYFSSFLATTDKTAADSDAPVSGSLSGTVGDTTLSTPTIASHTHPLTTHNVRPQESGKPLIRSGGNSPSGISSGSAGGGGSHTHPFSGSLSGATADVSVTVPAADVKYANVIIAAKD